MPVFVFSHQGLALPLLRRWPRALDAWPFFVGAAMPDVADGTVGLVRGALGKGWGHSLAGAASTDLLAGFVLAWISAAAIRRLSKPPDPIRRMHQRFSRSGGGDGAGANPWIGRWLFSILAGTLTHIFFDFFTHADSQWLYPWVRSLRLFPDWWSTVWYEWPLPLYAEPYPIGPHFIAWWALTFAGAWMFVRAWKSKPAAS